MTQPPTGQPKNGLPFALGAYGIWGFFPLYFKLLNGVSALEMLAHRILWSLPVVLLVLLIQRQFPALRAALADKRAVRAMMLSALFISVNWGVYIWSVMNGHILATSLGYYLNPLVNVLLGRLVLGERLNPLQKSAVGIAALAVTLLLVAEPGTLWISITLAFSFGSYGLVRKMAPVESVPGQAMETLLLFPFAFAGLFFLPAAPLGFGSSTGISLLLAGSGIATVVPLLLFGTAARRMSYSALGFVQYMTPSIVFLLGVFHFHEPMDMARLACFGLIWIAIAVFSVDAIRRMRA